MQTTIVQGATRITVSYEKTVNGLIIFICDNGAGLSTADKKLLFDKKPGSEKVPGHIWQKGYLK